MSTCDWHLIDRDCRKAAAFLYTYPTGEEKNLCEYHAGVARRDSWHLVGKLRKMRTQPGSADCEKCGQFISTNGADAWRDGRGKTGCPSGGSHTAAAITG